MGIFGTKGKFGFGTGRDDDFDEFVDDNDFETSDADEETATVDAPAAPVFTPAPVSLKIVAPKAYEDAKEITDFLINGNTVLLVGIGSVNGDLVLGLVTVQQTQIVILGLQVHIGQDQLILDHLPQDSGHLVAVHLDQRGLHLNFSHKSKLLY